MSSRTTRLVFVVWTLALFSAATAALQAHLKGIVQTPGNTPLVAREQVAIDGAGQYDTKDHGEFEFDLGGDLKVGEPARFRVYHVNPAIKVQQWIVISPCDLQNGRTFALPAVGSQPISIVVLPKGDQRLKYVNQLSLQIYKCIIEEAASEFMPVSHSRESNRRLLFHGGSLLMVGQLEYRRRHETQVSRTLPRVVEAENRIHAQEEASLSSLRRVPDSPLLDETFLRRKAEELGFTPEELVAALKDWVRSVEDQYEKGLAALYEGQYAEAIHYISGSIPSPPGQFLKRYVPLARAEYERGNYPAAEGALRKVLAVHSKDPLILSNLGLVSEAERRRSEAGPSPKQPPRIDQKVSEPEVPIATSAREATTNHKLVVRRDPSISSPIIDHLSKDDRLTLVETTANNGYYHIKTEHDVIGWVLARHVKAPQAPIITPTPPIQPPPSGQCDDGLWGHVYHSYRLIVHQRCISVTGTIVDATNGRELDGVRHEPDGDTHGWLKVDSEFQDLLNAGNLSDEGGNLVFEIICKFPVIHTDAKMACQGYTDHVTLPPVGSHVRIVGTYVQDTFYGQWMEIHPVTSVAVVP